MTLFRQRWVKLLALFGVMLHAHALTGHHARSMSMALAQSAAPAGYIVICRADGTTKTLSFAQYLKGDESGQKAPSKGMSCPLCSGALVAFAVESPALTFVPVKLTVIDKPALSENAALPVARASRPPATGPPTHA